MKIRALTAAAAMVAAAGAAAALPAHADTATQTVSATLGSSVSISTSPTASVDFGSLAVGANSVSGGQVGVTSNVAYTLTVTGLKSHLTEYVSGAYDDATKLSTAMALVPTLASGAGVPVASANVGTSAATIGTGVGGTTDIFNISLNQTVLTTDMPTTYRNELTYTASGTL